MTKNKINKVNLIYLTAIFAGTVLSVISLFLSFVAVSSAFGHESIFLFKLGADAQWVAPSDSLVSFWSALVIVFSVVAVISCFATSGLTTAKQFANFKVKHFVFIIAGAIAIVSSVLAIIFTFCYCGELQSYYPGSAVTFTPAVGAWLIAIGSIISGIAGIINK